jgi:hypothetical protein
VRAVRIVTTRTDSRPRSRAFDESTSLGVMSSPIGVNTNDQTSQKVALPVSFFASSTLNNVHFKPHKARAREERGLDATNPASSDVHDEEKTPLHFCGTNCCVGHGFDMQRAGLS